MTPRPALQARPARRRGRVAASADRRRFARLRGPLAPVLATLGVIVLMELLTRLTPLGDVLPAPTAVVERLLVELPSERFWQSLLGTATVAMTGFVVGGVLGIVLGMIVGSSALLWRAVRVPVEFLRPVPVIALVPVLVLTMGVGVESKALLVGISVFWMLFIQSLYGVQDVDPTLRDTARAYGIGRVESFFKIVLPTAGPYIATGVRIAGLMALVVAIAAELVMGGGLGLGVAISNAASEGLRPLTFAYITASGLLGLLLSWVLNQGERLALFWHSYHRGARTTPRLARLAAAGAARLDRVFSGLGARVRAIARAMRPTRRAARPTRRTVGDRVWLGGVLEVAVPVALLATWWFASSGSTDPYFPSLESVLAEFGATFFGLDAVHTVWPTLWRLLVGFALGELIAIPLGLLIGLSPLARRALDPTIQFMRSIPGPALLPLFVMLFGISDLQKVLVVAFGGIFITLLNTIDGVRGIDGEALETMRAYGVRGWLRFSRVITPGALPRIFAGMRVHLVVAMTVIIIAEMTVSRDGLGNLLLRAQSSYDTKLMWAGVFMIGILGYLLNLAFTLIERRILSWHRRSRQSALA